MEALGGDRRAADRNHAAAVARLREQIAQASRQLDPGSAPPEPATACHPITAADRERAVWTHYISVLQNDDQKRAAMPTPAEIDAEYERLMQRIDAGEADVGRNPIGMFNVYADYELKAGARHFDENNRSRRLAALRSALATSETRFVDGAVRQYIEDNGLVVEPGSSEWRELAVGIARAEIQALQRTLERDKGDYTGQPSDPIVKPPSVPVEAAAPVPLKTLFNDYIASHQALGKHRDGAKQWENAVVHLTRFLGHSNARKITKRNLLDWRDRLLAEKKSPKTIANVYLASVRAILRWAFENDRLPTNEGETVRQEVPKKVLGREKGYTTAEAVKVLKASIAYQPAGAANPSNRESLHITAAKRWLPVLCAFTGARVAEMAQLRKEDVRQEGDRWILRITPDAGSVKTSEYRDVPLHSQVIALGFIEFLEGAKPGPLFHAASSPGKYLANARTTAGRLSEWLQEQQLVPEGVQPSHGWRHRFKTLGRELGLSDRVIDAIQGHAGKTAGDGYGDVTIVAKARVIDALADYDLGDGSGDSVGAAA